MASTQVSVGAVVARSTLNNRVCGLRAETAVVVNKNKLKCFEVMVESLTVEQHTA